MSESKHTPGPWQLMGQDSLMRIKIWSDNPEQPVVAMARVYKGNEKTAQSNARLIAAAPDLLKALYGMIEVFVESDHLSEYEDMETVKAARAAIAKAEGK